MKVVLTGVIVVATVYVIAGTIQNWWWKKFKYPKMVKELEARKAEEAKNKTDEEVC